MIKNLLHASRNIIVLVALFVPVVHAQESAATFPSKQVRIIVPFASGSSSMEQMARLLAQKLGEKWGQSVIVENRGGGNTVIGTLAAARATPDGYTMILVNATFAINTVLTPNLPYDSDKDFAAVAGASAIPFLMVVHSSVPANNFREMISLLKAGKPGEWDFATVGSTGIGRIAGETFAQQTGVKLQHIPFKGGGEVASNLLAGNVKFTIDPPGVHVPHVKSGKLKAFAVTGPTRLVSLPDVPTFIESGIDFDVSGWFGIVVHRGTPPATLELLRREFGEFVASKQFVEDVVLKNGYEPTTVKPEGAEQFLIQNRKKWASWVKSVEPRLRRTS